MESGQRYQRLRHCEYPWVIASISGVSISGDLSVHGIIKVTVKLRVVDVGEDMAALFSNGKQQCVDFRRLQRLIITATSSNDAYPILPLHPEN